MKTKLVPVLYIGWGKTSCFKLDCIHKMETWKHFAILKHARKIVWPANENFTTFFKKHVFESWRCLFQEFILEKRQALLFESTLMSVGGDGTAPYLKMLEKFVLPANKNFTTFFKKHVYELWQSLFQASILKKGKYSCLDLHYAHKVETGQSYI